MWRILALSFGLIVVFSVSVAILLQVLPGPHKPADYLVIGGVATLLCLVLVFVTLGMSPGTRSKLFYKERRRKRGDSPLDN